MFVVGGTAGFNNAFGVAIASTNFPNPSSISNRWILVPNTKSAIPSALTQPVINTNTATGSYTIPIPLTTAPTSGSIISDDGHGTSIADHTSQTYSVSSSISVYVYPFIIPNAWKYDPTAPSGPRWYVDTTIEPWWAVSAANPAPDTNTNHLVYDSNGSHGIQSSNFSGTHSAFPTFVFGFEDFTINTEMSLNPPTLNQEFNDFVFAPVSFST